MKQKKIKRLLNKWDFELKGYLLYIINSVFARKLKCLCLAQLGTFSLGSDWLGKFPLKLITSK